MYYKLLFSVVLTSIFFGTDLQAANRYWIAASTGSWSNTANWSTSSGGAGGASVPGSADVAYFNAGGLGDCNLDATTVLGGLEIDGYTGTIDVNGFFFSVTGGSPDLNSGTITNGGVYTTFQINTTGTVTFEGTTMDLFTAVEANRIYFHGSVFNDTVSVIKTGNNNDNSDGGNQFNSTLELITNGNGSIQFSDDETDTLRGDLYIGGSGSGNIVLGRLISAPFHQTAGNTIYESNRVSWLDGNLTLRYFTYAGTQDLNITVPADVAVNLGPDLILNCRVNIEAGSIGLNGATFNEPVFLTTTGSATINGDGGNVFNDTLQVIINGTGQLRTGELSPDSINGPLLFGGSGTGSFNVGYATAGPCYFTSAAGISNAPGSWTNANLRLHNFYQTGSGAITLNGGTGSDISFGPNSEFSAVVDVALDNIYLDGAEFQRRVTLAKTGGGNNVGDGGNVFNDTLEVLLNDDSQLRTGDLYPDSLRGHLLYGGTGTSQFRVGNSSAGSFFMASGYSIQESSRVAWDSSGIYLQNFNHAGGAPCLVATLTDQSDIYFASGSTINGRVDVAAGNFYLDGTTFNAAAKFHKIGGGNNDGDGGNVFNDTLEIINDDNNRFATGDLFPDSIRSTLFIGGSGTGDIRFGEEMAGPTYLAPGGTITESADHPWTDGDLHLGYFTYAGTDTFKLNNTFNVDLNFDSGGHYNCPIDLEIRAVTFNGCEFNEAVRIVKNGNGNPRSTGGNVFRSSLEVIMNNDNDLRFGNTYPDTLYGPLYFGGTGEGTLTLGFRDGGTFHLVNNTVLESTTDSWDAASLNLRRFEQTGPSAVNIQTGGDAEIIFGEDCFLDGRVVAETGTIRLNGTEFNRSARFIKIGGGSTAGEGGNVFNDSLEVIINASSSLRIGDINNDTLKGNLYLGGAGTGTFATGYGSGMFIHTAGNNILESATQAWDSCTFDLANYHAQGTGATNLIGTDQGRIYFGPDSEFNGSLTIETGDIYFEGARFNRTVSINKIGGGDNTSDGGNVFMDSLLLELNDDSALRFGDNAADSAYGNVFIGGIGSGTIRFGNEAVGTFYLNSGNILTHPSGWTNPTLDLNTFIANGTDSLKIDASADADLYFGAGCEINGPVQANIGGIFLDGATFNDNVKLTKTGTNNNTGDGGNVFNGNLEMVQNSTAGFRTGNTAPDTLRGNLIVGGSGTGEIAFGNNVAGPFYMAPGGNISVSSDGWTDTYVRFDNFEQDGICNFNLESIAGSGTDVDFGPTSSFDAPVHVSADNVYFEGTTFNDSLVVEKRGAGNNHSRGGCTFNGFSRFTNAGSGRMRFATISDDTFNSNVEYIRTGTGGIQPAYSQDTYYYADIYFDLNNAISTGSNGGTVFIAGSTAQAINGSLSTATPEFERLTMNSTARLTLNTPVNIGTTMQFTSGVVNTDATNILTFINNATSSGASDASHVDGPVSKIGNDAFTFPTGDSSEYRPIAISAPSSGGAEFRAEYFNAPTHPTYDTSSIDPSIDHVSIMEYWLLDRLASTNAVEVTLSWDDISGGVDNPAELLVARWDGGTWRDHGNGSTTGDASAGTITSSTAITDFSPFTLGSSTLANPLPIELVYFEAEAQTDKVALSWFTALEINNDFFTVERSADGLSFHDLTTVNSKGSGKYQTTDHEPYPGTSYYRLKQTDFDGTFTYSDVVPVQFSPGGSKINVFPNPASSEITLSADRGITSVEISDMNGKLMQKISNPAGSNEITLQLSNLKSGLYSLRIYSIDGVEMRKFEVLR